MSSRRFGDASVEQVDRAREIFISRQVSSFKELADKSKELLGQHISMDRLKRYSDDDPNGTWTMLRAQNSFGDASAELEDIRSMIYLDIMNPETSPQARAQLTNSYMTLLSKGNIKGAGSAKTSIEQALDLKAEALKELALEETDDE